MNILQILPSLDVGGVETGTVDLARFLVSRGHKAITISGGGRLVKELDAIGSRHYRLPVGNKSVINIIRMVGAISDIIRREDIDIVHARSRVPALIAYFACRKTNRVFITTAHGYYKRHLLSSVMGWGKFVIVASNIMAKHMVDAFGVPRDRIRMIPRGVDMSRFAFRDPEGYSSAYFTIGMVSRITPLKGHKDFIRAASILYRKIPNLRIIIVGGAAKIKYREELDILVKSLGMADIVKFLPATGDVPNIMKGLDLIVSATTTPEAFGRVIMEAQAAGVPVVATKVGGVVDIVEDQKTGMLCMPQNPKDMADKIERIYRDRNLWKRLAISGRRFVEENLSLDRMTNKTIAVYEDALKTQNILVIKISSLGDVILCGPSLRAIRQKFPDANIKVLVGLASREALERCPYINELVVCNLKGKDNGIKGILRLGTALRKRCFDIVFDLQNNNKSHLLAALSMAGLRYGYDNGKLSFLLNHKVKDDAPFLDPVEHQFRTLGLAGIRLTDKRLELWPSPSDAAYVDKLLEESWVKPGQPLAGINVRASERWVTKNWPIANIAELCDRLAKRCNVRVVLTGAKSDVEFAERIARLAKSKPVNAVGKTSINELAELIGRFRAYLTPDSAPMHVAAAMDTPYVALFGPTDPSRHAVKGSSCIIICKISELRCGPCYKPSCMKNFKCMKSITVDEVYGAMTSILGDIAVEGAPL